MGELKCRPSEWELEDKVRCYPTVRGDSERRWRDLVGAAADEEPGQQSSWPGFARISCKSLWPTR